MDLQNKRIVLFGTGQLAEVFLNEMNLNVDYIIDINSGKHGETFYGKTIYDPQVLKNESLSEVLVVLPLVRTGSSYPIAVELLNGLGLREKEHFITMHQMLLPNMPYEEIIPRADYAPWKGDSDFLELYQMVKANTLVDQYRCFNLWELVEQVKHLEGLFIEVGVWRGGTGAVIAQKATQLNIEDPVLLCDTFEGVVKADPRFDNVYKGGEHKDTHMDIVKELIEVKLGLRNVRYIKGVFPDDCIDDLDNNVFRYCHIDVDVLLSAKSVFEWVWERLVRGGIVVFDDYGFMVCKGITNYVNELKKRQDVFFQYNLNGQGVLMKL